MTRMPEEKFYNESDKIDYLINIRFNNAVL